MGLRNFALRTLKGSVKLTRKAGKASVAATKKYAPKVKDATIRGAKHTSTFAKDSCSAVKDGWTEDLNQ